MKFKKNNTEYVKEFGTPREAVKALKQDSRIKDIKIRKGIIIAETNPIMPKLVMPELEPLLLGPVGSAVIYVKDDNSNGYGLAIRILKKDIKGANYSKRACPHVMNTTYYRDDLCWGNMNADINTIMRAKDYYWLIKYALDLLEDWSDEEGGLELEDVAYDLYRYQLNYNPKLEKKLKKALKKAYDSDDCFAEALDEWYGDRGHTAFLRNILGLKDTEEDE